MSKSNMCNFWAIPLKGVPFPFSLGRMWLVSWGAIMDHVVQVNPRSYWAIRKELLWSLKFWRLYLTTYQDCYLSNELTCLSLGYLNLNLPSISIFPHWLMQKLEPLLMTFLGYSWLIHCAGTERELRSWWYLTSVKDRMKSTHSK